MDILHTNVHHEGIIFKFCVIADNIDDCSSELTVFYWLCQSVNSSHDLYLLLIASFNLIKS